MIVDTALEAIALFSAYLAFICLVAVTLGRYFALGAESDAHIRRSLDDELSEIDWTFPSRMDARNGHVLPVANGARVGRPPAGPCDPFNEQRPAGRPGAA